MKKQNTKFVNLSILSLVFSILCIYSSQSLAFTQKDALQSCVNSLKTEQVTYMQLQNEYISILDQKLIPKPKKQKKAKA